MEPFSAPFESRWLHWPFDWLGQSCQIPALFYHPEKKMLGLDLVFPMDGEAFAQFYEANRSVWGREAELSPVERDLLEAQNPLRLDPRLQLAVGGVSWRPGSGCSRLWVPDLLEEDQEDLLPLLQAYGLEQDHIWLFCRRTFSCPPGQEFPQGEALALDLTLGEEHKLWPIEIYFTLAPGEGARFNVVDPVDGSLHQLALQCRRERLPQDPNEPGTLWPEHGASLHYHICPPLARGHVPQFREREEGDNPILREKGTVLGGARGKLFLQEGELEEQGVACSAFHFQEPERFHWCLVGIQAPHRPSRTFHWPQRG